MDVMKDKEELPYIEQYAPNCVNANDSLIQSENITGLININTMNDTNGMHISSTEPGFTENQEITINSSQTITPKPKKTKKIKEKNKSQWRKEKGNKYLNKPYKNYKGIEVKSKEFEDYDCKCQMKCNEVLSASERQQEFQKFWELGSYEAQAIFLIARVDEQITKKSFIDRRKKDKKRNEERNIELILPHNAEPTITTAETDTDSRKNKRQFSRTYILKSKQVCRNMFVKTLGITSKRINTALVKMRSKSLTDHRGLSQGGKNKISDKRYDEVVDHIKKMPKYQCSHVQGKFDSDFLPPELSLSKMYDLYAQEVEQPVSLSMYKKIYYGKFNYKSKNGKKEICNICKGERKLKSENLKKQQLIREREMLCATPPSCEVIIHEQYRPTNFIAPPINYNQAWLPAHNFQMQPQHNPTHYFDPISYE